MSQQSPVEVYLGLRELALHSTPEKLGLLLSEFIHGEAYGAVMEFETEGHVVTLWCSHEIGGYLHVALYTSSGFSVIGENFPPSVFAAARHFLALVQRLLSKMKAAASFPRPQRGFTQFFAFTRGGPLTIEFRDDARWGLPHKLLDAGHAVIVEISKVVPGAEDDGAAAGVN